MVSEHGARRIRKIPPIYRDRPLRSGIITIRPPSGRRKLEARKAKAGRRRAADEAPECSLPCVAWQWLGHLPGAGRHEALRFFALRNVGAEMMRAHGAVSADEREAQGRARLIVPHFGGVDAMLGGDRAHGQQKVNGRRSGPAILAQRGIAIGPAIEAAFGMRRET
jgi:hypothetical protein